jgi:hypothetical protein
MRIIAIGSVCLVLSLLSIVSGCRNSEPEQKATGDRSDSARTIAQDLPTGRFQLPTAHTPAPDLWITLPKGYTVKNVGRLPNDEFFIIRSDDPSLKDPNAVTPGFLRVYVGVNAQSGLDSTTPAARRPIVIAGRPLEQRSWSEKIPQGKGLYYQREVSSDDFFAPLSFELARTPLHLHLYAAGFDSARVSELASAALTIGFSP